MLVVVEVGHLYWAGDSIRAYVQKNSGLDLPAIKVSSVDPNEEGQTVVNVAHANLDSASGGQSMFEVLNVTNQEQNAGQVEEFARLHPKVICAFRFPEMGLVRRSVITDARIMVEVAGVDGGR